MLYSMVDDDTISAATRMPRDAIRQLVAWRVVAPEPGAGGRGNRRSWDHRAATVIRAIALIRDAGFTLEVASAVFVAWRFRDLPGGSVPSMVSRQANRGEPPELSEFDRFMTEPEAHLTPSAHDRFIDVIDGRTIYDRYGSGDPTHYAHVEGGVVFVDESRRAIVTNAIGDDHALPIAYAQLDTALAAEVYRAATVRTEINVSLAARRLAKTIADLRGFRPRAVTPQ